MLNYLQLVMLYFKKNIIILVLIIIFLFFLVFFIFSGGVEVQAYKVQKENAVQGVTVTGIVRSDHDIQLAASITAKINEIRFKEGDFVKKGQILAILDSAETLGNLVSAKGQLVSAQAQVKNLETEPRYQQAEIARTQVSEALANVNLQRNDLARTKIQLQDASSDAARLLKLYQEGAVSFRDYEKAANIKTEAQRAVNISERQLETQEAKLSQTRENLNLILAGTKPEQIKIAEGQVETAQGGIQSVLGKFNNYIIKAPVPGYITLKILDKGEVATPSTPILRLVMPKSIYISAQVEENKLKNLKTGQTAYVVFDAYPAETFIGCITEVLHDVDPITGTFIAKIHVQDKKGKPVLVGMTSDATIVTQEIKNAVIIPREFIFTKNKKQYVFRKYGNEAKQVFINSATFDNNRAVVITGLNPGDVIVKGYGSREVTPNRKIKIKEYYKK